MCQCAAAAAADLWCALCAQPGKTEIKFEQSFAYNFVRMYPISFHFTWFSLSSHFPRCLSLPGLRAHIERNLVKLIFEKKFFFADAKRKNILFSYSSTELIGIDGNEKPVYIHIHYSVDIRLSQLICSYHEFLFRLCFVVVRRIRKRRTM